MEDREKWLEARNADLRIDIQRANNRGWIAFRWVISGLLAAVGVRAKTDVPGLNAMIPKVSIVAGVALIGYLYLQH